MASIYPFRGVRYNAAKVGDLNAVVTPPYDVISTEERLSYMGRHVNSIVRLILPEGKYDHAASLLSEWLDSDALHRDAEPSIYVSEQEFEVDGRRMTRRGFTCLLRLEDYESRTVRPHENTLAKPLGDRLDLLRATRTNFDSVFGLHAASLEVLREETMREPDSVATESGVRCSTWKVSDPEVIRQVVEALASEPVLIADGHHRYAAALAYRDEMRKVSDDPNAPHEFVMMTLVSFEDPGLVILPTHRLVNGVETDGFMEKLSEQFAVREVPTEALAAELSAAGKHSFGLHVGKSYVISLNGDPASLIEGSGSDALKRLDVSVLHSLVLEKLFGIGAASLSAQSNLSYAKSVNAAISAVERGECQMAFLLNPTEVDEVKAVAAEGERMPQKSTFFYPKLLTGAVLRVME
ncbi:MAG: DUF1015 domain-containing protein [Armatimonadota bacterium]